MRTLWILRLAAALTILSLCATLSAQSAPAPGYAIVVNASNPNAELDRRFVADAFLKKVTTWPQSGDLIRPVDLPARSPVRRRFTEDVIKRSVEAVKSYWQQHIFAGRDLPPPELVTDDEVIAYVSRHPGAIGYVTPGTVLHGAKPVSLR